MAINSRTRLDSWKEIAEYLGRDVRTVIRWEREKNLPVHRIPGGKRRSVFAYPEEVEAWLDENHNGCVSQIDSPERNPKQSPLRFIAWPLRSSLLVLGWVIILGLLILPEWQAHPSATGNSLRKTSTVAVPHLGRVETAPSWQFQGWSVMHADGKSIVAVAVGNPAKWKSTVLLADPREEIVGRFVYGGSVTTLRTLPTPAGPLLLVGGTNHSVGSAAVAVIDVKHLMSNSFTQSNSVYPCNGCPSGRPFQYLIFPRSKLNRIAGHSSNQVETIEVDENVIKIRTTEVASLGEVAEGVYEFTRKLEFQKASFNDAYWDLHHELKLAGKIHHPKEQCPDRFGPTLVQSWNAETGWTRLHPHGK
jgi:hypothetical protein